MGDNRGPLTTTFTAPAACASLSSVYLNIDCAGSASILHGPLQTGSCYPPKYSAIEDEYYSPGLCPSGYTAACTSRNSIGTQTETVLTCCPTPASGLTYSCSLGSPDWTWGGCNAALGGAMITLTSITTISCGVTAAGHQDYFWDGVAQARSIKVMYQQSDLSLLGLTAAATTTTKTTPAAVVPSAPTSSRESGALSSTTSAKAESGHGSTVPSGTLVAVAVVCGLAILLLAATVALLFRRSRRLARQLREQVELQHFRERAPQDLQKAPELDASVHPDGGFDDVQRHEMYTSHAVELDDTVVKSPASTWLRSETTSSPDSDTLGSHTISPD